MWCFDDGGKVVYGCFEVGEYGRSDVVGCKCCEVSECGVVDGGGTDDDFGVAEAFYLVVSKVKGLSECGVVDEDGVYVDFVFDFVGGGNYCKPEVVFVLDSGCG